MTLSARKMKLFQEDGHKIKNGKIQVEDHSIEFAKEFPDRILDRKQLQRFLGCLNNLSDYYQDLATYRKILTARLRKNSSPIWTEQHTEAVRRIKSRVLRLPILALPDEAKPKVIEE